MRGLIVDGQTGPVAMMRDVGPWRVTYEFGRTTSGRLGIARIEVAPWRPGGVIPNADGITSALIRELLNVVAVRRYIWTVNREEAAQAKTAKRRTNVLSSRRMSQQYRKVLARYNALVADVVNPDPHPSKTIADELGVNRNTVRVWLKRARDLQG